VRLGFRFVDIGVRIELALKIISRQNLFKVGIGRMGRGPAEMFPPRAAQKTIFIQRLSVRDVFSERVNRKEWCLPLLRKFRFLI